MTATMIRGADLDEQDCVKLYEEFWKLVHKDLAGATPGLVWVIGLMHDELTRLIREGADQKAIESFNTKILAREEQLAWGEETAHWVLRSGTDAHSIDRWLAVAGVEDAAPIRAMLQEAYPYPFTRAQADRDRDARVADPATIPSPARRPITHDL